MTTISKLSTNPLSQSTEEIKEGDHFLKHLDKDDQLELIQKYRRMDGLKGSSRIIELITGYEPKRVRDTRFYSAMMIAVHIDDRVLRLRASVEGRQVIDAIERLSVRMRFAGKSDEVVQIYLEDLKGVNGADRAIADTLWVKYRLKISDRELAKFSNYLVKGDATYPSWSEQTLIKDFSRINDAGNPAQVFIMKKPARYHQQYRTYKRRRKA